QPTTIFVVSGGISVASTALVDGLTTGNRHLLAKTSGNASYAFAGSVATTTNTDFGEAGVLAALFDGSSSQVWLNGDTDTLSVGSDGLTGLTIGNGGPTIVPAGN